MDFHVSVFCLQIYSLIQIINYYNIIFYYFTAVSNSQLTKHYVPIPIIESMSKCMSVNSYITMFCKSLYCLRAKRHTLSSV